MIFEDLYFIDTPVEIEEKYYSTIEQELINNNVSENAVIYCYFVRPYNYQNNGFFKIFISNKIEVDKDFNKEADFLIFIT